MQFKDAAEDVRERMGIMNAIVRILKPKGLKRFFGAESEKSSEN